jgi:type I restriction enzyme S subunit
MGIELIPFTELLSAIVDNRGRTCPTAEAGLPLIATNCVRNDLLYPAFEKVRYVAKDTYENWFRGHPVPGDLIFVCKGTPGRVCMAPEPVGFCIAQDMVGVRADPKKVYPKYLFAALRSPQVQTQIGNMHVGTMIPHFKKGDFDKLLLPVPDRHTQEIIGDTYFEFSAKIDLNRQMNATLEAMARALFQSWFVDFDPVRAKLDGRQPAGIDEATANLFPDSFEDSELGQIPKGWSAVAIERLCDTITSGGTPPRANKSYWEPATVPWFKTGELLDGPLIDAEEKISEEGLANCSCKLWPAGTILFALYASPTVGRFGVLTKPGTANQAAAALIAKPAYGVPFLMGILYEARAELQRVAVGAAQQNINQGVLKSHVVVVPPPALAKAYSEKVAPWFQQRIKLAEQSQALATVRDTLLPKLLSGELRVPQAIAA